MQPPQWRSYTALQCISSGKYLLALSVQDSTVSLSKDVYTATYNWLTAAVRILPRSRAPMRLQYQLRQTPEMILFLHNPLTLLSLLLQLELLRLSQKHFPPIKVSTIPKEKAEDNTDGHHSIRSSFLFTNPINQQERSTILCNYLPGSISPVRSDANDSAAVLSVCQRPKRASATHSWLSSPPVLQAKYCLRRQEF